MISSTDIQTRIGHPGSVSDDKIGQVHLDNQTGDPQWVTRFTGQFSTALLVNLHGAAVTEQTFTEQVRNGLIDTDQMYLIWQSTRYPRSP